MERVHVKCRNHFEEIDKDKMKITVKGIWKNYWVRLWTEFQGFLIGSSSGSFWIHGRQSESEGLCSKKRKEFRTYKTMKQMGLELYGVPPHWTESLQAIYTGNDDKDDEKGCRSYVTFPSLRGTGLSLVCGTSVLLFVEFLLPCY